MRRPRAPGLAQWQRLSRSTARATRPPQLAHALRPHPHEGAGCDLGQWRRWGEATPALGVLEAFFLHFAAPLQAYTGACGAAGRRPRAPGAARRWGSRMQCEWVPCVGSPCRCALKVVSATSYRPWRRAALIVPRPRWKPSDLPPTQAPVGGMLHWHAQAARSTASTARQVLQQPDAALLFGDGIAEGMMQVVAQHVPSAARA
eukprot:scaffold20990_cov73-Phaeocystis_antarctica.AAC.1